MAKPASLYDTHGEMCTSKSYEPDNPSKVFHWTKWERYQPGQSTSDHVSHKDSACSEPNTHTALNNYNDTCGQRDQGQDKHGWESVKEKDRCQTAREGRHSGIDPQSHPDCRALIDMGYSMREVKKAADRIKKQGLTLNVDTLLDVITESSGLHADGKHDASTESDDEEADGLSPCGTESPGLTPQPQPSTSTTLPDDSPVDIYSPPVDIYSPQNITNSASASTSPTSSPFTATIDDHQQQIVGELRAENEKLKQATTCKVCLDADVDTVFLPCRHLVCCRACADNVVACPMCREKIVGTVKTFLA